MTKNPDVTRICSACGIEKPLSAFLQLSETQGRIYGSICVTCRGINKPESVAEEDATTSTTEKRIGSKEKTFIETTQKRQYKDLKELFIKEAKKREEEALLKKEDIAEKKKLAFEHRKFYIDTAKNPNFLMQNKPSDNDPETKKIAKQEIEIKQVHEQKIRTLETVKLKEIIEQELQINSADFSNPFLKPPHHLNFQSEVFIKYIIWIGSSPVTNILKTFYKNFDKKLTTTAERLFGTDPSKRTKQIADYLDTRLENPSSGRKR